MWVGKTKFICTLEAHQTERVCLTAKASQDGFVDLNQLQISWKASANKGLVVMND